MYFGWTPATLLDLNKRAEAPLWSPAQSILVRHLVKNPEMCVLPPKPVFRILLDRINENVDVESYSQEFGARKKKVLSPRRLVLLMGLSISAENRLLKGREPSPTVLRMLQHINKMLDEYGDEAGFARLVSLAREEAAARGMTLAEVFAGNSWGVQPELKGGAGAEDVQDQGASDETR